MTLRELSLGRVINGQHRRRLLQYLIDLFAKHDSHTLRRLTRCLELILGNEGICGAVY